MRKALAVILWVLAAAALTAVGTAAVGLVTSQVNDPPPPLLSVEALEALPTVPSTAPPTQVTPSSVDAPSLSTTVPPTTPTTVVSDTSTTSSPDTSTTSPISSTTTLPPSATTTVPVLELRTFNLVGGSVVVEVLGDGVAWRSSTPQAGFTVSVEETGPEKVVVEFESTDPADERGSQIEVRWVQGELQWTVDEDD